MNNKRLEIKYISWVLGLLMSIFALQLNANEKSLEKTQPEMIFAKIDDITISYSEFMAIFRAAVRHKYYHGRVPEEELKRFQKKVADDIVTQILVHREAIKQGLNPDRKRILSGLDEYDKKYANDKEWLNQRDKIKPQLIERLEREDLIEQLQSNIKNIKQPEIELVKKYYTENPDKFTEPERYWVSVILLTVPPSADKSMWSNAVVAAQKFKKRIEEGELFSDIAKQYSGHPSGVNGGDLGYLHQGMLEGDAQAAVMSLKINQISEPVRVLEGVTLFYLNGINKATLKPYSAVKDRAADLVFREMQNKAWKKYTNNLSEKSNIYINDKFYVQNDE